MSKVDLVSDIVIEREDFGDDVRRVCRELFGFEQLPLIEASLSFTLNGLHKSYANAIRRVSIDELDGQCLVVTNFNKEMTNDKLIITNNISRNISLIKLRRNITDSNLVWKLDVTNNTTEKIYLTASNLTCNKKTDTLFNGVTRIGVLSPGCSILIPEIRLSTGKGDAIYNVCVKSSCRYLDLGTTTDLRSETSGYNVSCLVADPRVARVTLKLPATDNTDIFVSLMHDICDNIIARLRQTPTNSDSFLLPNETSTIAELLKSDNCFGGGVRTRIVPEGIIINGPVDEISTIIEKIITNFENIKTRF